MILEEGYSFYVRRGYFFINPLINLYKKVAFWRVEIFLQRFYSSRESNGASLTSLFEAFGSQISFEVSLKGEEAKL